MTEGITPEERIARIKLDNDYRLARVGLQGTLWGSWAALAAIVTMALAQICRGHNVIEGWPFTVMVGTIVVAVTSYGAFIFKSALGVQVKIGKNEFIFTTSSAESSDQRERNGAPHEERQDKASP